MRPFELHEFLEDIYKKIVTRDGRTVRIVYTDRNCDFPIVGLVGELEEIMTWQVNGKRNRNGKPHDTDLFFADGEAELTELENYLMSFGLMFGACPEVDRIDHVKETASDLLDIVKTQLEYPTSKKDMEATADILSIVSRHFKYSKETEQPVAKADVTDRTESHQEDSCCEVNLEKELEIYTNENFMSFEGITDGPYCVETDDMLKISKHFFELGLKVQKRQDQEAIDLAEANASDDLKELAKGVFLYKKSDFPKWKKNDKSTFTGGIFYIGDKPQFIFHDHYISLYDLWEKLERED